MKRDPFPPPEDDEEPRRPWRWLAIVSRVVSGVVFLVGFILSVPYFTGGELMLSIVLMIFPMSMIWYPEEIDYFGMGGYGEGGVSRLTLAVFGWVCLLVYLVIVILRAEGYL